MLHISHGFIPTRIFSLLIIVWIFSGSSMTHAASCAQFDHHIFANEPSGVNSTVDNSELTDGSAIANGETKIFNITLKDAFDNNIIPATGLVDPGNGLQFIRTVSMSLTGITNTMYLNQYSTGGTSSVYVQAPNNSEVALEYAPIQLFANPISSSTGSYPLGIRVYTPTANGFLAGVPISDPGARFGFTGQVTVTDGLIGSRVFSGPLGVPRFQPLYTTTILGDLKLGGFIEGTIQSGSIVIGHNGTITPPSYELQLEYGGSDSMYFSFSGSTGSTFRSIGSRNTVLNSSTDTSTLLLTKLTQIRYPAPSQSRLQLSTHLKYTLHGHDILYNGDVIGTFGGFFDPESSSGTQVGLKVIGMIGGTSIISLLNDQFSSGSSYIGGVSRSSIRNNITKAISIATRNISMNNSYDSPITSVATLDPGSDMSGSVLRFGSDKSLMFVQKASVGPVILNLAGGITGVRTLVVKGANLYITGDMYYDPLNPNSILGVVVQKDEQGRGGNLYIKPTVTNVVGSYVLDGSVMSSTDGSTPIGTSDITTLKNQLHIYGSINSENTIGGSRMSPVRCPSLISSCTDIVAQQYDLNYLRRYYLSNGIPFGSGKVIGSGSCTAGSCTFDPSSHLIQKFNTITDPLAKHPVIIEYNPLIISNPPLGFEQSKY